MNRPWRRVVACWCVMMSALFLMGGCATSGLKQDLASARSALAACKDDLASRTAKLAACEKGMGDVMTAKALAERRMKAYQEIARRLRAAFDGGTLKIVMRNGRMVVQLPNRILFDLGKAQLKPAGELTLRKLATVLKDIGGREILVAGHTDNVPVKQKSATYKTNWELSTLRALTVVLFLEKEGTKPAQMGAAGYGEHDPEADNSTEAGRASNRRTEIVLMPLVSEVPPIPEGDLPNAPAE